MAEWKKIIFSGSNAVLNTLTVTGSAYVLDNFAIGTNQFATGNYKLTVDGAISASGDIRLGTETTASFLRMRGSTNIIRTRTGTPLIFRRGGTEVGRFNTAGKFYVAGHISASLGISGSGGRFGILRNNSTVSATKLTGSFSGSFTGDGSGLTGVGGSPGGNDTEIQYNDGGSSFAGGFYICF